MNVLYLNPVSGIAGDMLVGALLDLGADCPKFHEGLASILAPSGANARAEPVTRGGLRALAFHVTVPAREDAHGARHFSRISEELEAAPLPESVCRRAVAVFRRLAEAEARVHGIEVDEVHFHEVGADDAIADIAGACLAMHLLDVGRVVSGPVAVGSGTVDCAHGTLPVPAPATAELLKGIPVTGGASAVELTTPTGAALLAEFCDDFGSCPDGRITAVGYGAGQRELEGVPNVLQAILLSSAEAPASSDPETVAVIDCNLDDMPGERVAFLTGCLLDAGALDVTVTPCQMKKGRQGMVVQVLAPQPLRAALCDVLLKESTTFGVRWTTAQRRILGREIRQVETTAGVIDVKLGFDPDTGKIVRVAPEFESCREAALANGHSLNTVYDLAIAAARQQFQSESDGNS